MFSGLFSGRDYYWTEVFLGETVFNTKTAEYIC